MVRTSVCVYVILLLICGVVPTWAQGLPANTISCSSGTACKKGDIPVFASSGGAATVADSIIKQSGTTISVAGSETATQNISAGGNVSATGNVSGGSVSTSGNISAATIGASSNISAGGNVSATGNVSGGSVSTSGNISGANISAESTISAGGVVNAGTIFELGGGPFAFAFNGNAFLGFAGNQGTGGTDNTGTGNGALSHNTSGSGQVAYGQAALVNNNTGNDNAAFGTNALFNNTTGSENTAIGVDALEATNGNGLTCVGFDCTATGKHIHDATAIGAHAMVNVSNALVLGSVAGVNGAKATTMIGIGTTSPTNLLTLGQGFGPSISDGWDTYSSRRWKTNIQPIHNALRMVQQLRGVSYNLKDSGKREIGVIAEEVGAVVPEVVSYEANGKDARGVDYSRLTALLIEATKQQQQEMAKALRQIRQQQSLLRAQSSAMRSLEAEVRESQETLRKVKAQVAASQLTVVAAK
jgi:endosialidase-like protein